MNQDFMPIPGYPGYSATRHGTVRGPRGVLSQWRNASGYLEVKVGERHIAAHRAVALAWLPNPRNLSDVNHIDGCKDNNRVENFEWCSRSENIRHALDTGLHASPETPVIGINEDTGAGIWARSQAEVKHFGFQQPNVNKCLKGERPRHRGFRWQYAA